MWMFDQQQINSRSERYNGIQKQKKINIYQKSQQSTKSIIHLHHKTFYIHHFSNNKKNHTIIIEKNEASQP
jgi:hypothetical protein